MKTCCGLSDILAQPVNNFSTFLNMGAHNTRIEALVRKLFYININACFICLHCKTLRRHKIGSQIIYRT